MAQANQKIRKAIRIAGVRHWQVAAALGIREDRFTRLLRFDLPEQQEHDILTKISELAKNGDIS